MTASALPASAAHTPSEVLKRARCRSGATPRSCCCGSDSRCCRSPLASTDSPTC